MLGFSLLNYQKILMKNSENRSILFSSQSFYPSIGGVSTLLLNLSKYLVKLDYKISVIHLEMPSYSNSSDIISYPIREYIIPKNKITKKIYSGYALFKEEIYQNLHGIIEFKYKNIYDVPGYKEYMQLSEIYTYYLIKVLSENNIDIVHFQDYQVMPGISAIPSSVKTVFSLHAPLLESINPSLSKWFLRYWQKADKVILSVPEYTKIANSFGLSENKISIIPPVIDKELMSKKIDLHIKNIIPKDGIIVSCIQRFDSKSGQEQLVKAFSKLVSKIDNVYLLLVGENSFTDSISKLRNNYFQEIKNLVSSLGITNKVIFTGNVDYSELSAIYDLSDIVVMLSKMECFGLAISEAMYKGKPVVATNVGGLAYQIKDLFNGYLVKPGDVNQTFKVLFSLCKSKKLREDLGNNGKERFNRKFDPLKIIPQYHELYQSLFLGNIKKGINYDDIYNLLR